MKKVILFICLFVPFALQASTADTIFGINKIPHDGITLNKAWKFHAGDNADWAKPGFDDAEWGTIDPSKDIYFLPQVRKAETGWFRLRLRVDSSLFNKTLGMTVYQTGISDIYINGKLIHHLGGAGAENESVRLYDQQLSLKLDTAGVQEIAIRFKCSKNDLIINYLTPNYCLKLVLTNVDELLSIFMPETNSFLVKDIILIALYIFLGVMSLFLYFSYRVERAYLIFGFYCIASIVQALLRIPTYAIKPVSLTLASICFLLSHLVSLIAIISLLVGLYKLYSREKSIFFYFIILYSVSTLPVFFFFYPWSNIYAVAVGLFVCIDALIITFKVARNGFSNAWVLFTTFLVFFLMFVTFMLIAAGGNTNLGLNIAALSLLVIPFGLSIFFAIEFARTGRDLQIRIVEVEQLSEKTILQEQEKQQILASQNETLEKQVEERTAELNQSLHNLKATQTQLIQAEKMASLGELTAGIAHEIQNPLNFVNNFSEVNREMLEELKAESEKSKAERDEQLELEIINDLIENEKKINHHGRRADFIVKGMLEHSRAGTGEKQPTILNVLCDELLKLSFHGLRAKDKSFNAEMITHFDPNLPAINVSQQDMGRVMLNLFNNAFYAVNEKAKTAGPDYKPGISVSTLTEKSRVIIKVKDNGNGISDEIKDKIMQPFFTTKPTGQGTGLGLSLSYDIVVKGHGGTIDVVTQKGSFAEFIVSLPL